MSIVQPSCTDAAAFAQTSRRREPRIRSPMPVLGSSSWDICPNLEGSRAVFDGHTLAGFVQQALLLCPHVGNGHVEPVNSLLERVHQPRQPGLQHLALPSILGARQLGDNDGARVTAVLFLSEPGDDPSIAVALGGLAEDVCVESPTHNFRRPARAPRRCGTSSKLGADSIPPGSRLHPDHPALPRLYSADIVGGERQDRDRAYAMKRVGRIAGGSGGIPRGLGQAHRSRPALP